MDPKEIFQSAVKIIKLDKETIKKVAEDKQTLLPAVLIVVITGLLSGVFTFTQVEGIPGISSTLFILSTLIFTIAFPFIDLAIICAIAYLFGGRSSYLEIYKPVAYSYILDWLGIIIPLPFIGWIPFLWRAVVSIVTLKVVMSLTQVKAICTVIIAYGVLLVCISIGAVVAVYFGFNFGQCIPFGPCIPEGILKPVEETTKQAPVTTHKEVSPTEQTVEPIKEVTTIKLPDNFPKDIPLPQNAEGGIGRGDEKTTTVEIVLREEAEKVTNFFETKLKQNSWKLKKRLVDIGRVKNVLLEAFKDRRKLQIQLTGERGKNTRVVIFHQRQ